MESPNALQWNELNIIRNYPFTDNSTLAFSGGFLPQQLIVDARIYIRGNYQQTLPAYISKLVKNDEYVELTISNGSGDIIGVATLASSSAAAAGAAPGTTPAKIEVRMYTIISAGSVPAGCLMVSAKAFSSLYSFESGEYDLDPITATFVVSCCEYLPGDQVQSINDLSGAVTLTAYEGIELTRTEPNIIKISIVGDPHFNRYDCVPAPDETAARVLELGALFMKQLRVVHYVKTSAGVLVGPYLSKLTKKPDGSIVLALSTSESATALEARPAFRITTSGNTITFSLAGA